jgi:hypothetical protein
MRRWEGGEWIAGGESGRWGWVSRRWIAESEEEERSGGTSR